MAARSTMKTETPNPDDGRLRQVLREWKVDASLPPRFDEQVWRRVEQSATPSMDPLALIRSWMARFFARPAFAFSYTAILLLAGLLAGFWQARTTAHRTSETLGARYVQMVDPYRMPR